MRIFRTFEIFESQRCPGAIRDYRDKPAKVSRETAVRNSWKCHHEHKKNLTSSPVLDSEAALDECIVRLPGISKHRIVSCS